MNERIKKHLTDYAISKGWQPDNDTLIEIIMEARAIYEEITCERRWWNDTFKVVNINGLLIGFKSAKANRDESMQDLGWEFDQSTICEVKAVEKTITVYERV